MVFVILSLHLHQINPFLADSGDNYIGIAQNLLEGKGFSSPTLPRDFRYGEFAILHTLWFENNLNMGVYPTDKPTAFWLPAYPVWLAFWLKIFPQDSTPLFILQSIILGSIILFLSKIGTSLFDSKTGILAASLIIFNSSMVFFPLSYPSENLFIPLFVIGIYLFYWAQEKITPLRIALFALIWTIAGLTRLVGGSLYLIALIALFISSPKYLKYLYIPLLITFTLWGSWVFRNYTIFNEPVFSTNNGYNFWRANNRDYLNSLLPPDREGLILLAFDAPENEAYLREQGFSEADIEKFGSYDYPLEIVDKNEIEIERELEKRFHLFLKENPLTFIEYSYKRVIISFSQSIDNLGQFNPRGLYSLYYLFLFIAGPIGFFLAFTHFRKFWFLQLIALMCLASIAFGINGVRLRLPLDVILTIFAGFSVSNLIDYIRHKLYKRPAGQN